MTRTQVHVLKLSFGLWRSLASALAWGAGRTAPPSQKYKMPVRRGSRLYGHAVRLILSGNALVAAEC